MRVFENQEFHFLRNTDPGQLFQDLEFRRCAFQSCSLSAGDDLRRRPIVRHVRLFKCEESSYLSDAIIEDVVIDGLKTIGLMQTWGLALKHVTLRGKIGRVMITQAVDPTGFRMTRAWRQAFDEANTAYYSNVDWALDISEAEFQECDIRGVPARLIRRDPETQVVVTRGKALEGVWRELDFSYEAWKFGIEFMLSDRPADSDVVLVAPKRHRRFQEMLRGLHLLRQAGVAEPD